MSGPHEPDHTKTWQPQPDARGADQPPGSEEQTAQTHTTAPPPQPGQPHQPSPGHPPHGAPPPYPPSSTTTYQPPSQNQPPTGPFGQPPAHPGPPTPPGGHPGQVQQPGPYGAPTGGYPPGPDFHAQATQYAPQTPYPPAPPQAGSYGPPPGQYGPPQHGQQPAPYGPPGSYNHLQIRPARPPRRGKLIAIGAAIAVLIVAVVAILGFWTPGFFITKQLDVTKAQAGVQHILTDATIGYGAKNVTDVKCNNGQNPTATKGSTFTCDATIDGNKRQVTVTIVDDNGTYQVSRPK